MRCSCCYDLYRKGLEHGLSRNGVYHYLLQLYIMVQLTLTMRFWVVPRQIQAGQFHLLPLSSQLSMFVGQILVLVGQMQFIAGYIAIYCQSAPRLLRTKSNCWLVTFQLSVITSDLWKVQPLSSWLISWYQLYKCHIFADWITLFCLANSDFWICDLVKS